MTTLLGHAKASLLLPEDWEPYQVSRLHTVTASQFMGGKSVCRSRPNDPTGSNLYLTYGDDAPDGI